jgi:DNA-binding NarL/FixJ family response regulator
MDIKRKKSWNYISELYNISNPKEKTKYKKYFETIDNLIRKGYTNSEIVNKLNVDETSIRQLIRNRRYKIKDESITFNDYSDDLIVKYG